MDETIKLATAQTAIEARIKSFEEELKALLEKYQLDLSSVIHFPVYKILPDEVSLALKVVERHGGQIITSYKEKLKKEIDADLS